MDMDSGANKTPIEVIKEGAFWGTFLETFILVLIVNGLEIHEKNLMNWEILIVSIIAHIVLLVFINVVLNVEHH